MYQGDNVISVWISILYRYRRNYLSKRLEQYGALGGSFLLVMTVYYNQGISQEKVAELLRVDKASIARAVKKLQEEGYLTREPDAGDRRAYRLTLSEKALGLIPEVQSAIAEWEKKVLDGLDGETYRAAERALEHMAQNACGLLD